MASSSPPLLLVTLLLTLFPWAAWAVFTPITITVQKGRVAYLRPTDLFPDPPPEGTHCKVEVVTHDPITMRVGKFEPQVFDCDFAAYTVKYTHNGSPLLTQDKVKLVRYVFAEHLDTIVTTLQVSVLVIEAPYGVIVKDSSLRDLEIRDFYGLSNPLDSSVLRFRYNYYNGARCTVHYNQLETKLPLLGRMIKGNEAVDSLVEDCRAFLLLGLRYKHRSPPSPDLDYISLRVEVIDPAQMDEIIEENLFLPVYIRDAFKNVAPVVEIKDPLEIEVEEFSLLSIDPQVMKATDDETPDDQLVYNVTKLPDVGYFVHLDNHYQEVTSFTQGDLLRHHIAYQTPGKRVEERKEVEVEFEVYDSMYAVSDPVSLKLVIVPSAIKAPKVAVNRGLIVVEGQSRPITTKDFMVVDSDNIEAVQIFIKGGLRHGRLEIDGKPEVVFSAKDLELGNVVYHHDGSENLDDKIMLRITDGTHTMRTKFPIKILPQDDSSPYLLTNEELVVNEGGSVKITSIKLNAHDKDSDDNRIKYVVKKPPLAGEIVKKYQPMTLGSPVTKFTQLELSKGFIYYHHLGGSGTDQFEIRLLDNHDRPNKSGKYSVSIKIKEQKHQPPKAVPGMTRQLIVKETDVADITSEMLHYEDNLNGVEAGLIYTITSQPFFLTTTITIDAGRIISTEGATVTIKDPTIPPIHSFTQSDINFKRVAYMPPIEDMGPIRRHAQFIFTVSDKAGNQLVDQIFDITIIPVNNQIPHMSIKPVIVQEGGMAYISTNQISAYDPDTDLSMLVFTVETEPRYGRLMNGDMPLVESEEFKMEDLTKKNIKYNHEGSESKEDSFELTLSDGENTITKTVTLSVQLANDQPSFNFDNLHNNIQVDEGQKVVLEPGNLAAEIYPLDAPLSFIVLQSPNFGQIQLEGHPASEFENYDLHKGLISYVHFGGEVGKDLMHDSATFAIFDADNPSPGYTPLVDLNITVLPVDNKAPTVMLGGPLFAEEGKTTMLTTEVLSAQDLDTALDKLLFHIIRQPIYGYIENTIEESGIGKAINVFSLNELKEGSVNYVQSNHTDFEPMRDEFEVYISDGTHDSVPVKLDVNILPKNDEIPKFSIGPIEVEEGGEKILSTSLMSIVDTDHPADRLVLSVSQSPFHGSLVLVTENEEQGVRIEVAADTVSVEELETNTKLVYKHDGSENFSDQFTLKLTDGEHVTKETANVKIIPLNDEEPTIVRNLGAVVNVDGNTIITERNLYSIDEDNIDAEIAYIIISKPHKGKLQYHDTEEWIDFVEYANFTQQDVNDEKVRYVHGGIDGGIVVGDHWDRFIFQLTDGASPQGDMSFDIEIIPSERQHLVVLNEGMEIKEGDTTVLTTDILSASDDYSMPDDLVFHIIEAPSYGMLAHVSNKNSTVYQFTLSDINDAKIIYVHTAYTYDLQEDAFKFAVVNNLNQSRTAVFHILIEPVDEILPTLTHNFPLTVIQTESVTVTPINLLISDPDTPTSNLSYLLVDLPKHGQILVNGEPIMEGFVQRDVDNGNVIYHSDGSDESGIDYFLFTITDNNHNGYLLNGTFTDKPAFFSILIQPQEEDPPKLIVNRSPTQLTSLGNGRYGFVISDQHLKAMQSASSPEDLVYTIEDRPEHGDLEHVGLGRVIKKKFTQEDIDDGAVMYVLGDEMGMTNDSFVFRVHDVNKNMITQQKFSIEWSIVQFSTSQYMVCEDAGVLLIPVERRGALNESITVKIKTRQLSAKAGVDFVKPKIGEVHFASGQTHVAYEVMILSDNVEENNEKFKVLLKKPLNSILGVNAKTVIQLIDYKNGHCADYIGMVTRYHPDPLHFLPQDVLDEALHKQAEHRPKPVIEEPDSSEPDWDIFHDYDYDGEEVEEEEVEKNNKKNKWGEDEDSQLLPYDFDAFDADSEEDAIEEEELDLENIDDLEDEDDDDLDSNVAEEDIFTIGERDFFSFNQEEEKNEDIIEREEVRDIFDIGLSENGGGWGEDEGTWDLDEESEEGADGKPRKSKHPLKDFRQERKNKKRRKGKKKNKKRGKKRGKKERGGGLREDNGYDMFLTTEATTTVETTVAPQKCTPDTEGLLYFDLVSSHMFRCNGRVWDKWGWGENYLQAAMVMDEPQDEVTKDCDDGWHRFDDDCYRSVSEQVSWDDGEEKCREQDGHLTHVTGDRHLQWLWKLAGQDPFWTGLSARHVAGQWEYSDGSNVDFLNWRHGFPRNIHVLSKNCVIVAGKAMWVNRPCYRVLAKYVCTKPLKSGSRRRRHRRVRS